MQHKLSFEELIEVFSSALIIQSYYVSLYWLKCLMTTEHKLKSINKEMEHIRHDTRT